MLSFPRRTLPCWPGCITIGPTSTPLRPVMTILRLSLVLLSAAIVAAPAELRAETIEQLKERENRVRAVVDKVMGSVVAITSSDRNKPGSGSGVIVQKDGLILTAAHVTQATGEGLMITFPDGRRVKGVALGANRT